MSYLATTSQTTGRHHRNIGRLAIGMPVGIKSEQRSPSRRNRGRHGPEYAGIGKTHLATALGYTACLAGKSVLFATAIDTINTLAAAQAASKLKVELKKYLSPQVLILDELGYRVSPDRQETKWVLPEWRPPRQGEQLFGQVLL